MRIKIRIHDGNQTNDTPWIDPHAARQGGGYRLKAHKAGMRLELVNEPDGRAPPHLVAKRVGKDLHLSTARHDDRQPDQDLAQPEIVIEGFYAHDAVLFGVGADGLAHAYVAEQRGEHAIGGLRDGAWGGQVLANDAAAWLSTSAPAASPATHGGMGIAGAAAGLGLLVAAAGGSGGGSKSSTPPPPPPAPADATPPGAPGAKASDDGSIAITAPADADVASISVRYTDEAGNAKTATATRSAGQWSSSSAYLKVDAGTGAAVLQADAVKDGTAVSVTATDTAGNQSTAATAWAGIDLFAPVAVRVAGGEDGILNAREIADGVKLTVDLPRGLGNGAFLAVDANGDGKPDLNVAITAEDIARGHMTVAVPGALVAGDGPWPIRLWTQDGNGRAGTPLVFQIGIDTTPPPVPTIASGGIPTGIIDTAQPTFAGSGSTGVHTIWIYDNGVRIGSVPVGSNGSWQFTPSSNLSAGAHTITFIAVDAAGNPSSPTQGYPFTIAAASVSGISALASVNEGSNLAATVTLSNTNGAANVPFSLTGTGISAADFGSASFTNGVTRNGDGSLNIPAGVGSFGITLPVIADNTTEGSETLTIGVGGQSAQTVINDTSLTPAVPATVSGISAPVSVNEGNNLAATVTLSNSNGAANVAFSLSGTGISAADFGTASFTNGVTRNGDGSLNIPAGVGSFGISLPLIADATTEGNETLTIGVGGQTAQTVINDTSLTPAVPATVSGISAPTSVNEGSNLAATVTLSNSNGAANVAFSLSGTGISAADFGSASFTHGVTRNGDGSLNIPAGVGSFGITLPVIADNTTEGSETLTIGVGGQTAQTVINDTSLTPAVPATVSDISAPTSVNEGSNLAVTVTLSNSNGAANVAFSLSGTGISAADFGTASFTNGVTRNGDGSLNIPAGVGSFGITLPVIADNTTEGSETLTIGVGGQSAQTVINDTSLTPAVPAIVSSVVANTPVDEGGEVRATVTMSNANGATDVFLGFSGGTGFVGVGNNGQDLGMYRFTNGVAMNASGKLNVPAGVTTFEVISPVLADSRTEGAETFRITVGTVDSNVVTINDTSIDPTSVTSVTGAANVDEGSEIVLTVTLSDTRGNAALGFSQGYGNGANAADFGPVSFSNGVTFNADGTLNVPAGVGSFTVKVTPVADTRTEGPEQTTYTIGNKSHSFTINDTSLDPPPAATVSSISAPASVNEGSDLVASVTLSNINGAANVAFSLSGTGITASDFGAMTFTNGVTRNANGTLTIPAGVGSFGITLPVRADALTEGNERLTITAGGQSAQTVINDTSLDPPAYITAISANANTVYEGNAAVFTVTLRDGDGNASVPFAGAQGGTGYVGLAETGGFSFTNGVTLNANGTLNVPAGFMNFQIRITPTADNVAEGTEKLAVNVGGKALEVDVKDAINTAVADYGTSLSSVNEGVAYTLSVNLKAASASARTFPFTIGGTATPGVYGNFESDYTYNYRFTNGVIDNGNGTITVPANVTAFQINFGTPFYDYRTEGPETVDVTIDNLPFQFTINDISTAQMNAAIASMTTEQTSVNEGGNWVVTVNLTNANGGVFARPAVGGTVDLSDVRRAGETYTRLGFTNGVMARDTYDGMGDYQTIYVPPGVTSFQMTLQPLADAAKEGPETLTLNWQGKTVSTTVNDTSLPQIVNHYNMGLGTINEDGVQTATWTYTVQDPAGRNNVPFSVVGRNVTPDDYTVTFSNGVTRNADGTVNIPAGTTSFSATFTAKPDGLTEGMEMVSTYLDGSHVSFGIIDTSQSSANSAVVTGLVSTSHPNSVYNIKEGDTVVYQVTMNNGNGAPALQYTLMPGSYGAQWRPPIDPATDLAPLVFSNGVTVNANGSLNVPAGVTTFTITTQAVADGVHEPIEAYDLAVGGMLLQSNWIHDQTASHVVGSVGHVSYAQANEGTMAEFLVSCSSVGSSNQVFDIGGPGITTADYTLAFTNGVTRNGDGSLNIPAGITSFRVQVSLTADQLTEGPERLTVSFGMDLNANQPIAATLTINDASTTPAAGGVSVFDALPLQISGPVPAGGIGLHDVLGTPTTGLFGSLSEDRLGGSTSPVAPALPWRTEDLHAGLQQPLWSIV